MTADQPARLVWPTQEPRHANVVLRPYDLADLPMVLDLATDQYVPTVGSLPANADEAQGAAWIARQQGRLSEGGGFSFCIADATTRVALGQAGLWTGSMAEGRATAGYCVAPRSRGRRAAGYALIALTDFAWTLPPLTRVELYIEPWNAASVRTAEYAGYRRERLVPGHQPVSGKPADMTLYAAVRP